MMRTPCLNLKYILSNQINKPYTNDMFNLTYRIRIISLVFQILKAPNINSVGYKISGRLTLGSSRGLHGMEVDNRFLTWGLMCFKMGSVLNLI